MKKFTEYKIITESLHDRFQFEREINHLMKSGWQPIGGLVVIPASGKQTSDMLYQALVKYVDDSEAVLPALGGKAAGRVGR
jgi:hypothetical protein